MTFLEVVVSPPAIYLDYARKQINTAIGVAGQNCYKVGSGAFTGDNRCGITCISCIKPGKMCLI